MFIQLQDGIRLTALCNIQIVGIKLISRQFKLDVQVTAIKSQFFLVKSKGEIEGWDLLLECL